MRLKSLKRVCGSTVLSLGLVGLTLYSFAACTKGGKTASAVRSGGSWKATPGEVQAQYPPNKTISDALKFVITTKEGSPVPNIAVDFRAFDVTPAYNAGVPVENMKQEILSKWNDGNFVMGSKGSIASSVCDAGFTREVCVGLLSGPSRVTNQNGEATVGFTTPNSPGGVMAVAVRVPENTTAADLIEILLIKITPNDDFANSGIDPLQSAIIVIPMLFDSDGRQVIQAGVPFNLAVYAPGIPNTQPGKGFMFDFTTEGLLEAADGTTVVVPSGSKRCEFRNSQCIVPGGPFRVLKPTTLSFSAKPSDPKFPVKPSSISMPVITGQASQLIIALSPDTKNIQNACADAELINKACVVMSADIDKKELYPMLLDAGGNWVESPDTVWTVESGPLMEAGRVDKTIVTSGKQTIYPMKSSDPGIVYDTIKVSVKGKAAYTYLKYVVTPGAPRKVKVTNQKQRATVPFPATMELKDRYNNFCYNFTDSVSMKLTLSPLGDVIIPPLTGLQSTVSKVGFLDHSVDKVTFTNGLGQTVDGENGSGGFVVAKLPPPGDTDQWPKITIDQASLSTGSVYLDVESVPLQINPGPVVQTLWRDTSAGGGLSYNEKSNMDPVLGIKVAADQQYNFYLAGYDAAANYAGEISDAKFWGVNYTLDDKDPTVASVFKSVVDRLFSKDPSTYNGNNILSSSCPTPDKVPIAGRPLSGLPNQEEQDKENATYGLPTNQPEENSIYCGIHLGLSSKGGVSVVAFNSKGIPGTGRILAIPNGMYDVNNNQIDYTNIKIKPAITPRLTLVAGAATKFGFEFRSAEEGPTLDKTIYSSSFEAPIATGHKFKIFVHAQDNEGSDSETYTGPKILQVRFSGEKSWAGIDPKLPSGEFGCEFDKGVCQLAGTYMLADARSPGLLAVKQLTSGGVQGTFAKIISTKAGTERRLFFASQKGGPDMGAVPETSVLWPLGRIITADDELPLAVAVCDAGGSYIRDADAADAIVYEGFKSLDGSYGDIFSTTTGDWKFPTLWNSSYDLDDVFVADSSQALDVTPVKFYSPDDATVPAIVTLESSKDTTKYSVVFVPQNRFGTGFAVPRSASNASLIGWPSSWWSITPGLPEHIETKLARSGSPSASWTKPGFENATTEQKQNWVSASNNCYDMTITIHDKKHNQLFNYTGVVDDVALKLMNVTALKPNGVDDELAGVFLDRLKNGLVSRSYYSSHNASLMKGPYRDGFYIIGMQSTDGGYFAHDPARDSNGIYDVPNSLNDWWRGRVSVSTGIITTPIKVCLYNGQTASNYSGEAPYAEKFIQLDMPGFQTADKKYVFPSFQSRGAGVSFLGPNRDAIQSVSSPHVHGDKITVFRGDVDHLHPTFVDSTSDTSTWFPNLNILTPSLDLPAIGVTDKCPATKCGATTIYWHEHDEAHNYMRPARISGFMTQSTLASSAKRGTDGPMPLQSPSSIIFDAGDSRLVDTSGPHRIYARNDWVPWWMGSTSNNFKAGAIFNAVVGPPVSLQVTRTGPSTLTTDTPFGVKFEMFDAYGNAAGAKGYQRFSGDKRSDFSVSRTLSAYYDKQPSNGPKSGLPKLLSRTGANLADPANPVTRSIGGNPYNKTFAFELAYSANTDNIQIVKSEEPLELTFKITDNAVVPWCAEAAGNCLSTGYQQLSATLPVSAVAGAPQSTVITSGVGISAVEYPSETAADPVAGYSAIFNTNPSGGETYPLGPSLSRTLKTYACAKDAFGNLGECASNNQFYFINQSNPSPVETLSTMLNVGFFSWRAARPGTFAIKAVKNGFTAISAPITIGARPLKFFKFENLTTTTNLQAGSEFQVKVCMVDEAENVITSKVFNDLGQPITDPDAELDVAFALFGMTANPEGRSLVLSTGSGSDFEAKKVDFGRAKVDFEQGCSNLYAQLYAKGVYNTVPLITMTYIDPMQSNKPISGSGIQVNSVLPGGFDHYATVISGAPRSGAIARVEAWSNPGSTNQSALSGGNRFDATIFARDSYGNDIVYNNNFTLGLQVQYSKTPSSLQLTCEAPDNNRACLSQSMSGAPVTIRNLAMDIPGNYFLFAKNSDGSGVNLETSDIFSAAASVKTIKKYGMAVGGSYAAYNGPMTFTLTAEDNAGNPIGGIEDQLSTLTFTWTDELGQPLSTHVAPFGVPGHPRFNSSCVTNLGKPNFDRTGVARFGINGTSYLNLRKTESVKINIRDSQTPSVTSYVTEPTQILPAGVNYDITCNKVSDNSDCTGTATNPFPMDASPENRFKLTVKVYDDCGNDTVGNKNVQLMGAIGRFEWLPSESKVTYSGSGGLIYLDMGGNIQSSFTNLFVRAVGQATYSIFDSLNFNQYTGLSTNGTKTYHSYRPTIATVFNYNLKNISAKSVRAGQPITFKLQAMDSNNQVITGIDHLLNTQKYTWVGGGLAPNGEGPTYPTVANPSTNLTFTDGSTGTLSATFRKVEQILDFYVIDDFVAGSSGVLAAGGASFAPDSTGKRRSIYGLTGTLPITVNEGLPSKFELSSASTTVKAGTPFDVKVTVLDKFNNLVTGFGSDVLKFKWTGASSSIGAPANPVVNAVATTPPVLPEVEYSFDPGKASFSSTGAPFILYRSNAYAPSPQESPVLTVTGTKTGAQTESGYPLEASLQFTVQPSDNYAYAKIGTASTYDLNSDFSGQPYSMSNDQTKVFFAHLFDPWGNYKGTDPRTAWTGSYALENKLAPTPGLSTILTPTVAGSGVVSVSCTAVATGCLPDSTGNISINPSPLKYFSVEQVSPAEGSDITAGSEVSLKVCMKDKNDQTITNEVWIDNKLVTNPNTTVDGIAINRSINILDNAELKTLRISKGNLTSFDSDEIYFGANSLPFVNGCANLYSRVLSAGTYGPLKPLINMAYIDGQQNGLSVGGSGLKVGTVSPAPLDHYVTFAYGLGAGVSGVPALANPGPNTYVENGGSRFIIGVRARDAFGNNVAVSKTVNLGLMRASDSVVQSNQRLKCGSSGNNQSCLTVDLSNSYWADIPYVGLDIAGEFFITATDGVKSISQTESVKLKGIASKATVKSYVVTSPTSAVAGQSASIKIEARDAAGQVITAADTDLKTLNFSWVDGAGVSLTTGHASPAPSLTAPILPANPLPFTGGTANVSVTLTKAESGLRINVKDDQSPSVVSTNITQTDVLAGSQLYYGITCAKVTGGADCSGVSAANAASINASPTDMFNLTLKAFDQYQNPKTDGALAPLIKLTWQSGNFATLPGRLEQLPETLARGPDYQYIVPMAGVSQNTMQNLFHRAGPHVISYSVDPLSTNYIGMSKTTYHSFQPHIDMVYQYVFSPSIFAWPSPEISGTTSMVAGTPQNFDLLAFDRSGNIATGIDPQLSAQKYLWSGPTAAPNGDLPVLPGPMAGQGQSLTFSQGKVTGLSVTFKNAEVVSNFRVTDDYTPSVAGVEYTALSGKRTSAPASLTVINATPSDYVITTSTTNVKAGSPFDVTVAVIDQFKNPAKTWSSDTLTFDWISGAGASIDNPRNGPMNAGKFPAGFRTFTADTAKFTTEGQAGQKFVLYKAPETSTLKVTGTMPRALGQPVLTGTLDFSAAQSDSFGYVKIASASTFDSTTSLSSPKSFSMATNDTKTLYAHLFDPWGNYKNNTTPVYWSGTGKLENRFNPVSAAVTTLATNEVGNGIVSASCSSLDSNCVGDSTALVSVGASPLKDFVVEHAGTPAAGATVLAGTEIPMRVCMLDKAGQRITDDVSVDGVLKTEARDKVLPLIFAGLNIPTTSENFSIELSSERGASFNANKFSLGSAALRFQSGCAPFFVKLYGAKTYSNTAVVSISHTATLQGGINVSGSGLSLAAVTPGVLHHYFVNANRLSSSPAANSVPAWSVPGSTNNYADVGGNRFDVNVEARDAFGNLVSVSDQSVTLSTVAADKTTPRSRSLICPAPNNDSSCLTKSFSGTSTTFSNLAIDVGGFTFYPVANSGSITTPNPFIAISATSSVKTVKSYEVSYPANVTAGAEFTATVVAKDASGALLIGADSDLGALNFTWQDGATPTRQLLSTHIAPNGQFPTGASVGTLNFTGGTSTPKLTLSKVETGLIINVQDSQTPAISSASTATTNVGVGASTFYALSCKRTDNSDCTGAIGSPVPMTGSAADKYNLTIKTFDQYNNPKAVTASPQISITRSSGASGVGVLEQFPAVASRDLNNNQLIVPMVGVNTATISDVFRRSATQTVSMQVDTATVSATGISGVVYHSYSPTIDTVYRYSINNLPTGNVVAGFPYTNITISALDRGGNDVDSISTDLNSQTFTWSGIGVAPDGTPPVLPGVASGNMGPIYPVTGLNFNNTGRTGTFTLTFYKAETLSQNSPSSFMIRDNYNGSAGSGGNMLTAYRWSQIWSDIIVGHAKASQYIMTSNASNGTNSFAGSPFDVTVKVFDEYLNPGTSWASDNLTFNWTSGANNSLGSPENPKTAEVKTAVKPSGVVSATFTNGVFSTSSGAFTLFRSETSTLAVEGSTTANTKQGNVLGTSLNFTTQPAQAISYVKIAKADSFNSNTNMSGKALDFSNNQTLNLFAHVFDAYGNYKGNSTIVGWDGQGSLSGNVNPIKSISTVVTPALTGSGFIKAICSISITGCVDDQTGTIGVKSAPLASFSISHASNPAAGDTVSAGDEVPLQICMRDSKNQVITETVVDANNETITNPEAALDLSFAAINITNTSERGAIDLSTLGAGNFNGAAPAVRSVKFTSGCANFFAKVYKSGTYGATLPLLSVTYSDPKQQGITISGSGLKLAAVNAKALDHYVTAISNLSSSPQANSTQAWSNPGTTNSYASAGGNRFDVTAYARDVYGNPVTLSGQAVNLTLVAADGATAVNRSLICSAPNNDSSCLSPVISSSDSVTVGNLAVDIGGQSFYVKATDSNNKPFTAGYSTLMYSATSRKTVKQYVVSAPSTAVAGINTAVTVTAIDNSGATIIGADADLNNNLTFQWTDGTNLLSTHLAPDGLNGPTLPSLGNGNRNFNAGTASANLSFAKAETGLKINVQDGQSPAVTSSNTATTDVSAGTTLFYAISCVKDTGGAIAINGDCSGNFATAASILASATDRFTLNIRPYDQYKNPRAGNAAEVLQVDLLDGSAGGAIKGWLEQTSTNLSTNAANEPIVDTSNSGGINVSGLYHRVGNHKVSYSIATREMNWGQVYHTFSPSIDMVYSYDTSTIGPHAAGNSQSFTITAKDRAGNIAKNIDSGLNSLSAQAFSWYGASATPAPIYPSTTANAISFAGGVSSSLNVTFKKAETVNFYVQDNYAPKIVGTKTIGGAGTSGTRRSSAQAIAVSNAQASTFVITPSTTTPKAGDQFGVKVEAQDEFGNVVLNYSDTLAFSWLNATTILPNANNSKNPTSTFTPSAISSASMSSGSYNSGTSGLYLYKASESPTLKVIGTETNNTTLARLQKTYTFTTVAPSAAYGYVRVTTANAYNVAEEISGSNDIQTDSPRFVFAHLFDPYGNPMPKSESVTWEGTGELRNKVTASGSSTRLAPTAEGSGTVTAWCNAAQLTSDCASFTSGNFTIRPGSINKLVWQPVTPSAISQNTEACTEFRIQAQDASNTPVNVTQATPVTFTSTNGSGEFFATIDECNAAQDVGTVAVLNTNNFHNKTAGFVAGGSAGVRTKNIVSGASTVSVWYANRTPTTNAQILAEFFTIKSAVLSGTITVGPTKRVALTSSAFEINAVGSASGTCGTVTYKFQDKWANDRALATGATINLRSTASGSVGTFYSNSTCSVAISGGTRTLASGLTTDTVYYSDTQANEATLRLLGTSDATSGTASVVDSNNVIQAQSVAATVRSGAFTISTASGKSKYPFTVNWAASAGARDYTVTYGASATSACASAVPAGVTVDSANRTATFNSGLLTSGLAADNTYYICVRANGYTGTAGSGTPQKGSDKDITSTTAANAFSMIVDNAVPTGSITAPSATSSITIGPAMTEMGSGSDTVFRGTATDSSAGVQSVEVRLQQGINFWNGTNWSATTDQWLPVTTSDSFANWTYTISDANMNLRNDNASHTLTVRITDRAGNVSTSTTKTFTWKNSSSEVTLSGVPGNHKEGNYYWNGTNLNVEVRASSMSYYKYSIVTTGTTCTPTTQKTSGNITDPINTDGQYTLCVLAYDVAENPTTAKEHTFYRDTTPPTLSGLPSTINANSTYTPNITATDTNAPAGSIITYAWVYTTVSNNCMVNGTRTPGASVGSDKNSSFAVTGCNNSSNGQWGSPVLTLTATDSAGNAANSGNVVTLNYDAETPYVSTITTTATGSKKANDTIDITVPFVKTATAPGNPNAMEFILTVSGVNMGDDATKPTLSLNVVPTRTAIYTGVSGKNLTFRYTVQAGDNVSTLVNGTSITLPAGVTIQDGLGNNIKATGIATTAWSNAVTIDTTAPNLTFTTNTLPNSNGSKKTTNLGITISDSDTSTYLFDIVSAAAFPITGNAPTGADLQTICNTGVYGSTWTPKATALSKDISLDTTYPQNKWVVVCAQGRDAALNIQSGYTAYAWIKDTVAPGAPSINAPAAAARLASVPAVTWASPAADVNKIDLIVSRQSDCLSNIVEQYVTSTRLAGSATSQQLGISGLQSGQSYTDGTYYVCLYTYDVAENKSSPVVTTSFEIETDTIHVSWTDSAGVNYQTKSGIGSWLSTPETIATGTFDGRTSLAVDASGVPFVGYTYDDGVNTRYSYEARSGGTWSTQVDLISSASSYKTGLYGEMAISSLSASSLKAAMFGFRSTQGLVFADSDGAGVRGGTISDFSKMKDVAIALGTNNTLYALSTVFNGTNWIAKIYNRSNEVEGTITLPTLCTNALYLSAAAQNSDTSIGIALACHQQSNSESNSQCVIYYGTATYASGAFTSTAAGSWATVGTIKGSDCAVTYLNENHRPSLAINRPHADNGSISTAVVAFVNDNKEIYRWENTATPVLELVATGTGSTVGQQTLALDKTGKAYIIYQNQRDIMFTTNNGRAFTSTTGGWTTPVSIGTGTISGIGNIGINGMKARGNITNGR